MGWDRFRAWARETAATVQKHPVAAAAFAGLGIALALCYGATFGALAAEWSSSDTYSHGYLVPWISLYLAWTQRDRLRTTRLAPSRMAGAALVGVGLTVKVIGFAGGATVVEGLSLIVVLAGALLLFGGTGLLRVLLLPLLYLLFMIPFWDALLVRLSPPFQLFSARFGVAVLNVLGVPAAREGLYIHLQGITLQVAQACSGVNYLIAVIAIGIPLGWITFSDWQRRVALVVFGVGVALVSNAMRVALIGILLYVGVAHDTHGPGHVLQGLSVAAAGYVALFLGAWALSRFRPADRPAAGAGTRAPRVEPPGPGPHPRAIRTASALSIALVAVFAWEATIRPTPVPLRRPLSELPRQLGTWSGGEAVAGTVPLVAIPGSDRLERVYESPSRFAVSVLVLYVADQSGDRELVDYRTAPLLRDGTAVTFRPQNAGPAEVSRSETLEGEHSVVTFAWYDIGGHVTGSPWNAKLRTAWHFLSRGTSNAALVVIRAESSPEEARQREPEIRSFVERVLESLRSVLPSGRPTAA